MSLWSLTGMGLWLAVFDETGDVVSAISKRPDMQPLRELIEEKGDEMFSAADSIVIELDIDNALVSSVLRFAEKYGKRVYGLVANMSIASGRRDFVKRTDCFICNRQEAEILFLEDFSPYAPEQLPELLYSRIKAAGIKSMIMTLGGDGAAYASANGERGLCPAKKVNVKDTTGAGDAFCAGAAAGLTCGKTLSQAAEIGTKLAASVITINENVCPRFQPEELGIYAQ